ncbi:MAG: hypothetical protein ACK44Z_12585, partial [Pirellulaceae bacterium]
MRVGHHHHAIGPDRNTSWLTLLNAGGIPRPLVLSLGGTLGKGPGQFGFVTDVLEDSEGHLLVSNYGDTD